MNYECFDHWDKKIFLVDMKKELDKNFSELFDKGIRKYLAQKKRIWILINKKWFDSWIICHHCWHIPQCDRCSIAVNYHKKQYIYPKTCEQCWSEEIKEYGLGTQKLASILKEQYWAESLIIESETVNSKNKIEKFETKLSEFSQSWITPICIWTSLLTTPIKNRPFDLLIFLDADIWLNIPDYNANEKNFYFLYEAFVKHSCKSFIVQTLNPEQYLTKMNFSPLKMNFVKQTTIHHFEKCVLSYIKMKSKKNYIIK